jgi:hypothetical protein
MKRRKKHRSSRVMRSNNILLFKVVDPIIQSLLFILFVYSIDVEGASLDITYTQVFYLIVGVQVAGAIANLFINEEEQLKFQRIGYLVAIGVFLGVYHFAGAHVQEKYIETIGGRGAMKMPLIEIVLLTTGTVICFWYYVTCFREVRDMLAKAKNDE